jgi:ribosome-associated protein
LIPRRSWYNRGYTRIVTFALRRHLLDSLELGRLIVDVVENHKAEDIVLLDLGPDTVIADYFVIATGTSDRQLRALADHVRESVKEKVENRLPYGVEGSPESGWVLMDYGDVIVHLFMEEERRYYDLEGFWKKASVVLSIQ